jgi:hypothetical protein
VHRRVAPDQSATLSVLSFLSRLILRLRISKNVEAQGENQKNLKV